jgi:DNA-binding CsgD family transcriptional regulator
MTNNAFKPDCAVASSPRPSRRKSVTTRRAGSLNKAEREARIIGLLNRGVSVAEIATRESLSLKRLRNLVREILARRMPQPPAEFLALQISRLNEALLVSYGAMHSAEAGANFEAVDRVVKIVRDSIAITDLRPTADLPGRRTPDG